MGGRGNSSKINKGSSTKITIRKMDKSSNLIRDINDKLNTTSDVIQNINSILRSTIEGGGIRMTFDYADIVFTKLANGKYKMEERGIEYNPDGSYSPYRRQREVSTKVLKDNLKEAVRFSFFDADGLRSKQFSKRRDRRIG